MTKALAEKLTTLMVSAGIAGMGALLAVLLSLTFPTNHAYTMAVAAGMMFMGFSLSGIVTALAIMRTKRELTFDEIFIPLVTAAVVFSMDNAPFIGVEGQEFLGGYCIIVVVYITQSRRFLNWVLKSWILKRPG